jgi:putative ABC transport system permease protein
VTISSNSGANWEGKPADYNPGFYRAGIGDNFIDFYNLKIVNGRGFSPDLPTDTVNRFIINETAAKIIGRDDPVGHKLSFNQNEGTIIGVVKNFNFHSLHLPVEPLALSVIGSEEYKEVSYISVKVIPGRVSETTLFIQQKLKELSPHYINRVTIFSDRIDDIYSADRKQAAVLIFTTILALFLTCLGQYSLTSLTTRSRTREIVIRKVMGSQTGEILGLLTSEIAGWISVSLLFAFPVALLLMTKWLQNFAFHISIGAGVFLYSFLITLFISALAVGYNVIKLSRVNPAEIIRHE